MPQQYTPQDNKLVPWPIVTEPDREINTPIGVFYNANFDKALEAYNTWLSLPRPLILDEKDFKEGEVYELDKHFRIESRIVVNSNTHEWMGVCDDERRIVAIPIVNEPERGITEDSVGGVEEEGGYYYDLFKFFSEQHDLILVDTEIQDIIDAVQEFLNHPIRKTINEK
jgi:hypothetical protein